MKRQILICGSRRLLSENLIDRARSAVWRVWHKGDDLLVGDALGIDAIVVLTAEQLRLHYMCYGVSLVARNGAKRYSNVQRQLKHGTLRARYRMRDEWMIERADIVLAFWNGQSNGTKYCYEYAKAEGKVAYLVGEDGVIETNG